jgi:hypothetical protein
MTEAEWLTCADPSAMLVYLRGKASDRKFRLFAAACCRRAWHLFKGVPRGRRAVEEAERFADSGLRRRSRALIAACAEADRGQRPGSTRGHAALAAACACGCRAAEAADACALNAAIALALQTQPHGRACWDNIQSGAFLDIMRSERAALCGPLRDLFGNPFRPAPPVDPAWLAWNGGAVPKLAQAIYDGRELPRWTLDNTRLAILADALEEAGCTDQDILSHCRGGGEHVRGCFVVDLLTGRD